MKTTALWTCIGAAALLCGSILPAPAQTAPGGHPHHPAPAAAVTEFLERARQGTARYHDRSVAIADGYRLLGPDFPGMGEHWIHLSLLMGGRIDASEPQVLTYARVRGEIALLGVAYAVPLVEGEAAPSFPPGVHWHDHTGTIDEESVLLNHALTGHARHRGTRVAMLHAWIWLDNPAGIFEDNNWSLPFVRLGLTPPADAALDAAKALSLVSGGDAYYLSLLRAVGQPGAEEQQAAGVLLEAYRKLLSDWIAAREPQRPEVSPAELSYLSETWRSLWEEIDAAVSRATAERLRPIWNG